MVKKLSEFATILTTDQFSPSFIGFNGRLELENYEKSPTNHEVGSYHPVHQAHQAASAAAAAAAAAGLAPHQLVEGSDLSNELWQASDFEVGFAKESHGPHSNQISHQFHHQPHPYDPTASALNLMEYSHGDMIAYPDQIVEQPQHYEFYEQPIEPFGYYDYVAT